MCTQKHILPKLKREETGMHTKQKVWTVRKFFFFFDFWVDELTHGQSCKIVLHFFHRGSGHRVFTWIETRTMRHTNTHRWNWGLIVGDGIWRCNYISCFWWTNKNIFCQKINKNWNEKNQKTKHFSCLWVYTDHKYIDSFITLINH